jgi:hypothetical protein
VRTWELELERQGLTVEGVYKGSEQ